MRGRMKVPPDSTAAYPVALDVVGVILISPRVDTDITPGCSDTRDAVITPTATYVVIPALPSTVLRDML